MSDLCPTSADSCSSDSFVVDVLQWLVRDILAKLCFGGVLMSSMVKRDFAIEKCATSYTSEAEPVDHRGRVMWSWTADQLRQRCASEFYRLDDGTMSTRFLTEQGAHDAETPSSCIAALHYAGDSKGFPVFFASSPEVASFLQVAFAIPLYLEC